MPANKTTGKRAVKRSPRRNSLNIMVDKHGDDIVILGLEGDLKKATHQLFMDNIEAVLANSSPSVILNLMLLEELDSVGLRSFISAMARVGQSGGKVVMVEV